MCTGVSIEQWRASIGVMAAIAHNRHSRKFTSNKPIRHLNTRNAFTKQRSTLREEESMCLMWHTWLLILLLILRLSPYAVGHTEHMPSLHFLPPQTGGATECGRRGHISVCQYGRQISPELSVGELCVSGSSLLPVLSFLLVQMQILLMLSGDVEPNPGPTGKGSSQYNSVRNNMTSIIKMLESNPSAIDRLRQKFKEERWLDVASKSSSGEMLVTLALQRIEEDTDEYEKFITMLKDIDGMDLVVRKLTDHVTTAQHHTPRHKDVSQETNTETGIKPAVDTSSYVVTNEPPTSPRPDTEASSPKVTYTCSLCDGEQSSSPVPQKTTGHTLTVDTGEKDPCSDDQCAQPHTKPSALDYFFYCWEFESKTPTPYVAPMSPKLASAHDPAPHSPSHESTSSLSQVCLPHSVQDKHPISNLDPCTTKPQFSSSSPDSPPPSKKVCIESPMSKFTGYIKAVYKQMVVEERATKWPPTPSKIYINMVCVDKNTKVSKKEADECTRAMIEEGNMDVILRKKRSICFSDIAKDVPELEQKVILVEGAPGVGKSTFAWEYCRRWGKGEIAQQYQLVLLLKLRDERVRKAQSLSDLLYYPLEELRQAVLQELVSTLGVNTLIILEGFDELPSTCRTQSSVFLQLIHGELLPLATILVTSRPWATQELHKKCRKRIFQHIEILGFTRKQIEEYVTSVFANDENPDDKVKEIMSYIRMYPHIRACMYIPLNCAIVVSVYQESKAGKCILPKTLTELYYALIRTLLLRYLYGNPKYSQKMWNIQFLKTDLPEEVYSKLFQICQLAYEGIYKPKKESGQLITSGLFEQTKPDSEKSIPFTDTNVFEEFEFRSMWSDPEGNVKLVYYLPPDFDTLGLMQSVHQLYVTQGEEMSHNFLHLTVQEFLAALHISNMSLKQQLEHLKAWEENFDVVLRFLAGLTKLDNVPPERMPALILDDTDCSIYVNYDSDNEPFLDERDDSECDETEPDVELSENGLHWLFEMQRDDIIPMILKGGKVVKLTLYSPTLLDYYCLGYCIVRSQSKWSLEIVDGDICEEEARMLVAGVKTKHDRSSARIVKLTGEDDEPIPLSMEAIDILLTELGDVLHLRFEPCIYFGAID